MTLFSFKEKPVLQFIASSVFSSVPSLWTTVPSLLREKSRTEKEKNMFSRHVPLAFAWLCRSVLRCKIGGKTCGQTKSEFEPGWTGRFFPLSSIQNPPKKIFECFHSEKKGRGEETEHFGIKHNDNAWKFHYLPRNGQCCVSITIKSTSGINHTAETTNNENRILYRPLFWFSTLWKAGITKWVKVVFDVPREEIFVQSLGWSIPFQAL